MVFLVPFLSSGGGIQQRDHAVSRGALVLGFLLLACWLTGAKRPLGLSYRNKPWWHLPFLAPGEVMGYLS